MAFGEVFVNLDSGKPEGSTGKVALYRELVTLADEWSFLAGSAWLVEQTRLYSDRRLLVSDQGIPLIYRTSVARGGAQVTRSFGSTQKYNLTWGVELIRRVFEATRARLLLLSQRLCRFRSRRAARQRFADETVFQIEQRTTRYLATRDVETLSLQESFSLGQTAALRVYPAARSVGSSRDLLGSVA